LFSKLRGACNFRYVRSLQRHSFALQQLRNELARLSGDISAGMPALRERLLELDTRLALAAWTEGAGGHGDDGTGGGMMYGGAGSETTGPSRALGSVSSARAGDLARSRASVERALGERAAAVEDLEAVMEDMDARLAQRVWAKGSGAAHFASLSPTAAGSHLHASAAAAASSPRSPASPIYPSSPSEATPAAGGGGGGFTGSGLGPQPARTDRNLFPGGGGGGGDSGGDFGGSGVSRSGVFAHLASPPPASASRMYTPRSNRTDW